MTSGILYIVATPIGNLEDITLRALETLKRVDLIVCEDTRTTKKLLKHYEIETNTLSFYARFKGEAAVKPRPRIDEILGHIEEGKNIALVTDAGTPGISDPGNQLVEAAVAEGICVIPIPGVSAITTLASVSGIDMTRFVFLGFPPHKKGRETFFKEVLSIGYPVMYFESPHRIVRNLELLEKLGSEKKIIVGRELTKMFEEIIRGETDQILDFFAKNDYKIRGEFVIIVY